MSSSLSPGSLSLHIPSSFTTSADLHREISTVRPLPKSTFRGLLIRLRYNLLSCSPPFRKLLLPGFRRFGRPPRRWISLRCQLGNLHRRDSHPLEWQLASLHVLPFPMSTSARSLPHSATRCSTSQAQPFPCGGQGHLLTVERSSHLRLNRRPWPLNALLRVYAQHVVPCR